MKTVVMYGAGNIGRGFIGELFSRSGYEVVFIDIDTDLIERLNRENEYPIRVVSNEKDVDIKVRGVRGVNGRDSAKVAEAIAGADIMATAVGVNILPKIAPVIAQGLRLRWKNASAKPLNILICENMLDAHHYLRERIGQEFCGCDIVRFNALVGLVEASIGRMVPVMTEEMKKIHPLLVCVEPYDHLPVDRDAFVGEIPNIVNMEPKAPFDLYIQRKLYMHNMGHAAAAYLGSLAGYRYIWEAVADPDVKELLFGAYNESSAAMAKEHNASIEELLAHAENLLYRFGNRKLGDTIERVGRDPIRKLSQKDRLVGAANLCMKHNIVPVYIAAAIAAGYAYRADGDDSVATIQRTIDNEGFYKGIERFSGLLKGPLTELVIGFYNEINSGATLQQVLKHASVAKK